ncbi:MAG TPA: DUF4012 domain-containing protein [Patescibacteria group bacterium]|jgi:hypothetical protein|nr:DUF4012 domain-containing protein [bacterium]HRT11070.1 DUF4012 domain-containing protein [Patescibacteria group bacterium]HRU89769.1 DUF4012 domain-containing protein [Patescibacteria group bacterium]
MRQTSKQYNNDDIPRSDFLLDLRQQIIDEPLVKKHLSKRKKRQFHWPKISKFTLWGRGGVRVKIKWPTIKRPRLSVKISRPASLRPLWHLIIIFLVIVIPLKLIVYIEDLRGMRVRVVNASSEGLANLETAGQLLMNEDFTSASSAFTQASASFAHAKENILGVQSWLWQLAALVPSEQMHLGAKAPYIIEAGNLASKLGTDFTILAQHIVDKIGNNDPLSLMRQINVDSSQALADSVALNNILNKIKPASLPGSYREPLENWQAKLQTISNSLEQLQFWSAASLDLLGEKMDRRYLLVFQNNAEARATGGFIGSYALLDVSRGQIKNLEIPGGGSYDTDGNLRRFVNPPAPLRLVSTYWKFWDANWWPDWPTSARELEWFLLESNGPSVDGVIALTPDVLETLLTITGPIDLTKDYGLVITADNFRPLVQDYVENKVSGPKEPKKIIGDLAVAILEKLPQSLNDQASIVKLLEQMSTELATKHILLYFNNEAIEQRWELTGLAGQLAPLTPGQDYLQVVNTNIAGGKTDLKIRQTIEERIEIQEDGSVINDVTIIREHTGERGDGLYGVRNVDWLRLYVPEGSELLAADGFSAPESHFFKPQDVTAEDMPAIKLGEGSAQIEPSSGTLVYNELGRTVFANWSMVDPGETVRLNFRYRLPFNVLEVGGNTDWLSKVKAYLGLGRIGKYQIIIENQAGQSPTTWKVMWSWPAKWSLLWSSVDSIKANTWQVNDIVTKQAIGLLFKVDN